MDFVINEWFLRLINARVSERLNFLDPEFEATHSRIDVLETICQANTDRIEAIANRQSKSSRSQLLLSDRGESRALVQSYSYAVSM